MADHVTALPIRGKTYFGGSPSSSTDGAGVLGVMMDFDDVTPGSGVRAPRSNRRTTCILVRNASGIALLPKRTARWKSGSKFKEVDGYTTTTAAEAAGVIDEHLPAAGVAANDLFWLAVKGPSLMLTDLAGGVNNSVALNDVLIAMTAVTSQSTTAGRIAPWGLTATSTQTTDGTYTNYLLHYLGRALSARTTANTNADILVDLMIMK